MTNELIALFLYQLAASLLSLLLGRKSQVNAWAESNTTAAAAMKFFRATSIDPWMLVQSAHLAVNKRLPPSSTTPTSLAGKPAVVTPPVAP
jgi:hypothetical protein